MANKVETSREVRLWITQIIAPAAIVVAFSPRLRSSIKSGYVKVKGKIVNLLKGEDPA